MAFSEVQICNMALSHLGQTEGFPAGDGTVAGVSVTEPNLKVALAQCQLWYPTVRDVVNRDFEYGTTLKYDLLVLASDGTGETWDGLWENAWTYPADCVYLRGFVWSEALLAWPAGNWPLGTIWMPALGVRWAIGTHGGARVIFATGVDEDNPVVEYSARQGESLDLDADYAIALSWRLAAELSTALVRGEESLSIRRSCMTEYALAIGAAQRSATNEGAPYETISGHWMSIRNS